MSASAYKAAFTLSNSVVLYFNTLKSDGGYPPVEPELIQEEMTAGGADGSRYRDVSLQFRKWVFRTSADAASMDAVDAICKQYEEGQQLGLTGTLRLERGGIFRTYRNLKIISIAPTTLAGTSVGYGAEPNSNALIYCVWSTQFMAPQAT